MSSPSPLLVLENKDGDRFESTVDRMGQILSQPQYANKELMIISIVGTTRRGKSFLINLLLMFLSDYKYSMSTLFNFRGGSKAETKGIYMWSEPFIKKTPTGREIVVVVMDTQGTFDNQTTEKGNSIVFGLSTIMSSVQIYNIMDNIGEDDLKHLTLFSEFAAMAFKSSGQGQKTFQNLIFLIRDWINNENYGYEGGSALLRTALITEGRSADLKQLRKTLVNSFETISAYLCPDPGEAVRKPTFKGDITACTQAFQQVVKKFFESLLSEKYLKAKKIHGQTIKCSDFAESFKQYFKALNSNPTPENLLTATANIKFSIAFNEGQKKFIAFTETIMKSEGALDEIELDQKLFKEKNDLISKFPSATDDFTSKSRKKYLEDLEKFLKERIETVRESNNEKMKEQQATQEQVQIKEDSAKASKELRAERKRQMQIEQQRMDEEIQLQQQAMENQFKLQEAENERQHNIQMMQFEMEEQERRREDERAEAARQLRLQQDEIDFQQQLEQRRLQQAAQEAQQRQAEADRQMKMQQMQQQQELQQMNAEMAQKKEEQKANLLKMQQEAAEKRRLQEEKDEKARKEREQEDRRRREEDNRARERREDQRRADEQRAHEMKLEQLRTQRAEAAAAANQGGSCSLM